MWSRYLKTREEHARDELIKAYLPLAKGFGITMAQRLPKTVNRDEVEAAAWVGVATAIEKFDPGKKVKFEIFAGFYMRGHILDYLRSTDWMIRRDRQALKRIEAETTNLAQRLGHRPLDGEISQATRVPIDKVHMLRGAAGMLQFGTTIIRKKEWELESTVANLEDHRVREPFHDACLAERREALRAKLSFRENEIVRMYYRNGLTLREIGAQMGLSESRVSQLHLHLLQRFGIHSLPVKIKRLCGYGKRSGQEVQFLRYRAAYLRAKAEELDRMAGRLEKIW